MQRRLIGKFLLLSGLLSACGEANLTASSQLTQEQSPSPMATPYPNGAALLGTQEVKFCGFEAAVEPAFNQVVRKLSEFCAIQNRDLARAGRFQCGPNSCTLRGITPSGGPDHLFRAGLFGSGAGTIGIQFSISAAPGTLLEPSDGKLFVCMHPSLYAETRLHAREILKAKAYEGQAQCSSIKN